MPQLTRSSANAVRNASVTPHARPARRAANSLLSRLPSNLYKRLRPYLREVALEKGEYLYQQDDFIDAVYFPESGVISEFQILEDGRTIEVSVTGSEGAVGIPAVFSLFKAASFTQTCIAGSVWKINSDVLEREIGDDAEMRRLLHAQINANIRQLSQKIICNTYHSLEERFCSWLLTLEQRAGSQRLHVTQEHIARALGVHRPSVTYIAQALRSLRLIDYRRGRIVILDSEGLKKHACQCFAEAVAESLPESSTEVKRA